MNLKKFYFFRNDFFNLKKNRLKAILLIINVFIGVLYIHQCLFYNLHFYTEDERYIQQDMTQLSKYQWEMSSYRVSSSFGPYLYFPMKKMLEGVNFFITSYSDGNTQLYLIPMMLSKLTHTIMVMTLWVWCFFVLGNFLHRNWQVPLWTIAFGFTWAAMLPVNIFLVKVNNYDSIYNILSVVGLICLFDFSRNHHKKYLIIGFFLLALSIQEKFAGYPFLLSAFIIIAFFMGEDSGKSRSSIKSLNEELIVVIIALVLGSLLPSMLRFLAEFFWDDHFILKEALVSYQPFLTFMKGIGTALAYTQLKLKWGNIFFKHPFLITVIIFVLWVWLVYFFRSQFKKMVDKNWWGRARHFFLVLFSIIQLCFFLWAYAPLWYETPPTGVSPYDQAPLGTFVPTVPSDSREPTATFYYGAGQVEYIFIRLMSSIGFFKSTLPTTVLFFLLIGPFLNILSVFYVKKKESLLILSSFLCIGTMAIAVAVISTGVPFGGRYTNIYQTLLALASFLNFVYAVFFLFDFPEKKAKKAFFAIGTVLIIINIFEMLPYGPSYQAFGNIFYPVKSTGGWGEATSALVQASRKDPDLAEMIHQTYTTYTGLAIEKPFFTPLVNLRLVRSKKHPGHVRRVNYLLVESCALSSNTWLQKIMPMARKVEGAIIWEWKYPKESSAWLVDMRKIYFPHFEQFIDIEKTERHYIGEWEF